MTISNNYPTVRPSLLLDFANTEQLDPRITFSRPTTATYYDANTTALAEQNLVLNSSTIGGTNWQSAFVTVATNTIIAPDGNTTATSITANGTSAQHTVNLSVSTPTVVGYQTLSVYAQAGTNNFIQLLYGTDANAYANFTLTGAGAVGTVGSSATATITQVGSSTWYRCTVTTQSATAGGFFFLICTSATSSRYESNTLTTSVYLWGAQLEQRSSVTAYNATTTTAITNYIPVLQTASANQARFDHNPVTRESLGLLIEQQSTNLFLNSSAVGVGSSWTLVAQTAATNVIAPDGTLSGTTLTSTATAGVACFQSSTLSATSYTFSMYVKAGSSPQMSFGAYNGGFAFLATFVFATQALTTGVGTSTNTVTSVGNGWYRITASFTATAGANLMYIYSRSTGSSNVVGDTFQIWGAQLEALAFPTSYIPTVASQVTRSADSASMTGTNFSSWYNYQQGTLYAESWSPYATGANWGVAASLDDNIVGYANIYLIRAGAAITPVVNGVSASFGTPGASSYKATLAYQASSYASTINGALQTSATPTAVASGIRQLVIGGIYYGGPYTNGWIKKIAYYPIRVTNAQLQALTGS